MSSERTFHIPPDLGGERLDRVIVSLAPELSRSAAQRLLKDGHVRLDGAVAKASDKPRAGQTLEIGVPEARPLELVPEDVALDVVYEDNDLLVVNKPPEMVVHPAKGHQDGTLVNALLSHCALSTSGEEVRPGIVHRLDQHTSGLLLVAKHDQAHAALSRQVEAHEVHRVYHALVWGGPTPPEGRLVTHFGRHPHHRTMMSVLEEGRGREAITRYRIVERYEWSWQEAAAQRPRRRDASTVECILETGRTHQIRVHLAHLGSPLIGDPVYGDAVRDQAGPDELNALVAQLPGQALHAARLTFRHPITGQEIEVKAEPPEAFARLQEWLRQHRK
jgi:23S rRNA pseudouridine1911/1915/1917 synthase